MRKTLRTGVIVFALAGLIGYHPSFARETRDGEMPVPAIHTGSPVSLDVATPGRDRLRAAAAAETTILGSWSFDAGGTCVDEEWVSVDLTQHDVFFHVDDFAGLGGGDFGRLIPLEGSQSMWCGLRPNPSDPAVCGYATLPGYGNSWNQRFGTAACVPVFGDVVMDYWLAWDSEPAYDGTVVQVDRCDDNWVTINPVEFAWQLDGLGREFFSTVVPHTMHSGSVRLRIRFTSDGAWSDLDGLFDSDGGVMVDSLTVSDATGTVLPTELFESEAVGDQTTLSGNWVASAIEGYGDYAALYVGFDVLQRDPCNFNTSCMWGFLNGTTADYSCGGYPGVPAVPFENERGQFLENEIWSPVIPSAGTGGTFELQFDVYRDLPLDNLVFFVWHVRSVVDGCPGKWLDTNFLFHGLQQPDWYRAVFDVSTLVDPGASGYQVALGAVDACGFWCGSVGSGNCHSNAPLFDNPVLRRIDTNGPAWSVRDIDLFQDNFSGDGTTNGTVRADMALDVLFSSQPNIRPGDSVVVTVRDREQPLSGDPYTGDGPAVYAYVGVWPQGQPSKSGAALSDDPSRWPVVDSVTHNGSTWYCVRMDTVYTTSGSPVANKFCIDLDDDLFTPGDTVCYVFAAHSEGFASYFSTATGRTDNLAYALDHPMEFTCLPTQSPLGGGRILYVDNYDGLGAQPFFDTAFEQLGIAHMVDRYDVLGPTSFVDNGPASRVVDVFQQVIPSYSTILWNSGNLSFHSISDGGSSGPKQDDFALLYDFIHNLTTTGGLYLSGDNLAENWANPQSGGGSGVLRGEYMNFNLLSADHVDYGLGVSPLVIGMLGGCFYHVTGPDSLIAYGGCPELTHFDVLATTGNSVAEAAYIGGGTGGGAVLSQHTTNAEGMPVGVVLSGFSFHRIRDAAAEGVSARAEHLQDILECVGSMSPVATSAPPSAYRNSLAQNYPNPFNPATTMDFTVKERARVGLRVYNVRGQLVRTLVDDVRVPGITHRAEWDGRNDTGQSVASGVYFYRLSMDGFTQTRKAVLLK